MPHANLTKHPQPGNRPYLAWQLDAHLFGEFTLRLAPGFELLITYSEAVADPRVFLLLIRWFAVVYVE